MSRFHPTKYVTPGEVVGVIVVTALFTTALFVSRQYGETIQNIVFFDGPLGMLLYALISFLGVVLAPAAALPFLPIAVSLWGSVATALLSIAGWGSGSVVAFVLARRFGKPFVGKFMSIKRAEQIANKITGKYTFWFVLVSRMFLPTDIVSYAIGLFVPIRFTPYVIATFLGIVPLAFILAYGISLPLQVQTIVVAAILVVIVFFGIGVGWRTRRSHSHSSHNKTRDRE